MFLQKYRAVEHRYRRYAKENTEYIMSSYDNFKKSKNIGVVVDDDLPLGSPSPSRVSPSRRRCALHRRLTVPSFDSPAAPEDSAAPAGPPRCGGPLAVFEPPLNSESARTTSQVGRTG